jgi:rare lipoprotein A
MSPAPNLLLRALMIVALAVAGSACHGKRVRETPPRAAPRAHAPAPAELRDGGPAVPPDVSQVPEPVPRAEPRAAYGNRTPYTVLGRTYHVMASARGYVERGIASWYGTKFHGRLTSSREPYDMYAMTAAHKTLPLPSYVRVTNLDNQRSVIVRVNDRGPFHDGRIIDLSYAAAIKLGVHLQGTAPVEVRVVEPGRAGALSAAVAAAAPATHAPLPPPAAARNGPVFLQVGAFDDRDNARRVKRRLEDAGVDDVFLDRALVRGQVIHRVRVGPLRDAGTAAAVASRIARLGLRSIVVAAD